MEMEEGSSSLSTPRNRSALILEGFIGSFEGSGAGISTRDVIFLKDLLMSCNLTSDISETLYMKLLCFLAENWGDSFADTSITDVPLFKHLNQHGRVSVCSVNDLAKGNCRICMSSNSQFHSWLLKWNNELKDASDFFLIPESTFLALHQVSKREKLYSWMHEYLGILDITLHDFSYTVLCSLQSTKNKGLVIGFTHFLFNSLLKNYLTEDYISALCESMPLVDKYGTIVMARNGALLPASMSKWVELACTNLWSENSYVELSSDYFYHEYSGGENVDEIQLSDFLKRCINAADVPDIRPPDALLPAAFSPLSKDNALLLLDWIRKAMDKGYTLPGQFSRSITEGKWLKTNLGFKSPSESFLPTSQWESLLHISSVAECVPLVDENFYDNQINLHVNELESLGVVTDVEECCLFVAYRLVSSASTITLRKDSVLSLLRFIRYVVQNKLASDQIIRIFQEERWLKTSEGCRAPVGSVLFNTEWEAAQQISDLPFVDESYYGEKIHLYKDELKLLGVVVSFDKSYSLIGEHFKLPDILYPMTLSSSILILECIGHSSLSSHMLDAIKEREWIKTNLGYRCPNKCFLYNSAWGCLLHWADVPVIDESFYENSISSYMHELETIGVSVGFDSVCKNIIDHVKLLLCPSLTKEASMLLLECLKQLKTNGLFLKCELKDCISQQLWLKTCHGFLSPCVSAVYDSRWEPITQIADLPFIDKAYYGEDIYGYIDDLGYIGVTVEFSKAFHLVVTGFKYPKHRAKITASVVLSLLECIKFQLSESSENPLPAEFLRCIREKKWLKTYMGYRSPVKCFLYDTDWEDFLQREDAPFIDESYYGSNIVSYWQELSSIGVKVRVGSGCRLISQCLRRHTDFSAITRIYSYLQTFNWEPEAEEKSDCWIWIPSENCSAGEWVNANHCVLHAEDINVCSSSSRVLERYYDKNLLSFFEISFGVGSHTRK